MGSFGWSEAEVRAKIRARLGTPPRKARAALALKLDPLPWFTAAIVGAGFEAPKREHRFAEHLGREFAFDYAWPDRLFAVEADGVVHRIKGRWKLDLVKFKLAALLGWRVLHFHPEDMRDRDGGPAARVVIEYFRHGGDVAALTTATLWPPGKE